MTIFSRNPFLVSLAIASLATSHLTGETTFPPLSPKGWIKQVVGHTEIEIEYERPSARGRKVFGELVPFGELWRTGAGHSTKLKFDKEVTIGGQRIPSGQYSLFSIPKKDRWTIILNTNTDLYGNYNYSSEKDAIRFNVDTGTTERYYETLTLDIDLIPNNARVYLSWENTQIHFDVLTGTDEKVQSYIDQDLLTRKSKDSNRYAGAAEYLYYLNTEPAKAIQLTELALEMDHSNGWARRLKVFLLERQEQYSEALNSISEAIDELNHRELEQTARRKSISEWEDHRARIEKKIQRDLQ